MATALANIYPEQTFVNSMIYKAKHQIRKSELNGRMPIQLLIDRIATFDCYHCSMDFENEGKVKHQSLF